MIFLQLRDDMTMRELLRDARAAQVLERYAPGILHHPLAALARGWTVRQTLTFARRQGVSPERLEAIVSALRAL